MTFVNKMDRDTREPIDLLDEIESVLTIQCAPVTWPIGMGKFFKGIYHLYLDQVILYEPGKGDRIQEATVINGLDNSELDKILGTQASELRDQIDLVKGASHAFSEELYLAGKQTPVFFGSAINNFGIRELLDNFVQFAPGPQPANSTSRIVNPTEEKFSGFVFKIQANMDPQHRDRIAFLRVCSGHYEKGIRVKHLRIGRDMKIDNALTFMASDRERIEEAWPGDIIGIHNHGGIQIGDTFTQGEDLKFTGIPHFAPELFRLVRLKDPLKMKALQKGLIELSEEGATQVFRPLANNYLILGAVGVLQFDVVAYRLQHEYKVECVYEGVSVSSARWIKCDDKKILEQFKNKAFEYLALDGGDYLTYLAPSRVNLNLAIEKWPDIQFLTTREH